MEALVDWRYITLRGDQGKRETKAAPKFRDASGDVTTEGQVTTERFEEPGSEKTWKKSNSQKDPGWEKETRPDKFRKGVRSRREGKEGCIRSCCVRRYMNMKCSPF